MLCYLPHVTTAVAPKVPRLEPAVQSTVSRGSCYIRARYAQPLRSLFRLLLNGAIPSENFIRFRKPTTSLASASSSCRFRDTMVDVPSHFLIRIYLCSFFPGTSCIDLHRSIVQCERDKSWRFLSTAAVCFAKLWAKEILPTDREGTVFAISRLFLALSD